MSLRTSVTQLPAAKGERKKEAMAFFRWSHFPATINIVRFLEWSLSSWIEVKKYFLRKTKEKFSSETNCQHLTEQTLEEKSFACEVGYFFRVRLFFFPKAPFPFSSKHLSCNNFFSSSLALIADGTFP